MGPLPRAVCAAGVGVFGLLFVTVAARIVGIVGVSSQPTSGITLMTLLTIGGIFTTLGWGGSTVQLGVLTVGTVVATAASCAGDMSQDLKTGYLVGATPRTQQIGQLAGVVTACWVVAATLLFISETAVWGEDPKAPQATMMKTVIEGQLSGELPWGLVVAGAGLALAAMLAGLHGLTFAIGVYLPLETLIAVFIGGCVRRLVDGWSRPEVADSGAGAGILAASGLVAGEGLAGVIIAALVGGKVWTLAKTPVLGTGMFGELVALAIVAAVAAFLWVAGRQSR
jgi:putative OPT family oligopeptide transporter